MLRFDLPWLPPAEVRGNSRAHWAKKHRASKRLRESGYAHALEAGHEPFQRACVRFEFRHWRSVDLDNLSIGMKGFLDGLVDAGVVEDDAATNVSYTISYERGEKANTIVKIDALGCS